jgi:hypothetical protein
LRGVLVPSLVPRGEISADETRTAERREHVCAAMISIKINIEIFKNHIKLAS